MPWSGLTGQLLDHRKGEGGGLAGAGLGDAQHVAAGEGDRDRLVLDGGRRRIAGVFDRSEWVSWLSPRSEKSVISRWKKSAERPVLGRAGGADSPVLLQTCRIHRAKARKVNATRRAGRRTKRACGRLQSSLLTIEWMKNAPPAADFCRPSRRRRAGFGEVQRRIWRRLSRAGVQGTIISTYPDGRKGKLWLSADGTYTAAGGKNDQSSGHWTLKADKVCLKQSRPIPTPFSICTPKPTSRTWKAKAVSGEPISVNIEPGGRS